MSRPSIYITANFLAIFLSIGIGCRNADAQVPDLFREDTLTVCFMGDMMMHTAQINAAGNDGTYDFSTYFMLIEDRIRNADLAVANMEFTLAGKPYTGYPAFSAPDCFADYIADTGFDIFLAANNHIFDKGSAGASRTADIYREMSEKRGIMFTGLAGDEEERLKNTPLIVRRKGITLALVNFTYGTNCACGAHWPKTVYQGERILLAEAMKKAESSADYTIALPHWGPEYQLRHSQNQEDMAGWLVDKGADLIIGSHPHVVQDTCHISGVPTIYSLGNAVSNMSARNTQLEYLATLRIVRKGNGDIEMLPVELTWLWCSRPGGFNAGYTVIPIEEYIGRKDEWTGTWDYDKMMSTYMDVKEKTR